MDDYVIGLRGRSVLGYTVDQGTRPEGTWTWKEVKRRRRYRRATCVKARGERIDVLESNFLQKRRLKIRQKLSVKYFIFYKYTQNKTEGKKQ